MTPIERCLAKLERQSRGNPSPAEKLLRDSEQFRKLLVAQGLDADAILRSGDILAALQREFLERIVERLRLLNTTEKECRQ